MKPNTAAYAKHEQLVAEARAYKAQGHSHKEVAEKFGKSEAWSCAWCKGIAPQCDRPVKQPHNQYTNGKFDRIANVKRIIAEHNPQFEYVGGFTNVDAPVIVRCKVCGTERSASMVSLRHTGKVVCHECIRRAEQIKKNAKTFKTLAQGFNRGAQLTIRLQTCKVCGELFFSDVNRKYCPECSKQVRKKYYSMKKRHRKDLAWTSESNTITLAAVYKRDHGVCWICGQPCDFEANYNDNNYPSIDHVIPISKGGKDTWDNVRLAHRYCNSKKRNISPV